MAANNAGDKDLSVRMITLPNGLQVGIQDMDRILDEVQQLALDNDLEIQEALLLKAGESNYIASGAESQYGSALLRAYHRKFDTGGSAEPAPPKRKHAW